LTAENALHHDLRLLSTRFVRGRAGNTKTLKLFATYQTNDGMMVGGQPDTKKAKEQVLYGTLAVERRLYTQRRDVVWRFQYAFDSFKMDLATALNIARFVYVHRLGLAGYLFAAFHPRLDAWYNGLAANPDWNWGVDPGAAVNVRLAKIREAHYAAGVTLCAAVGF
jgi:hypothetical protein